MSETPNNDQPTGEQPQGSPGYWEAQAGSTPPPPYPGPQFNPQTGYPSDGSQPGYPQPGQPQPGYGQPYPQQPAYGQPYPPQPGYGYPPYVAPPQDHPKATTAMITGLIAVVGGFTCLLPLLAAPFAWVIGQRAKNEIDSQPGRYGGRGQAVTGMVLGIIGTVLLALGVVLVVVLVIVAASDPNAFD